MKLKMLFLSSIAGVSLLLLSGCQTSVTGKVKDDTVIPPPDKLIASVRKAIDPSGELQVIKTLNIKLSEADVQKFNSSRIERDYDFMYSKSPEIYALLTKTTEAKANKTYKESLDVFIKDGNPTIKVNDKPINEKEVSQNTINKYCEDTEEFRKKLTLGIFEEQLSSKVDSTIYTVNGEECYRLDFILEDRFIDNSDQLSLYVSCKTYLVKRAETDYFVIDNIKYKKFGKLNLMYRMRITDGINDLKVKYFTINSFVINEPIKDYRFSGDKVVAKEI